MSLAARSRRDPHADQRLAADPAASVWVAASAGTGKTTVLANRVLSLLLADTPPERILCLTFTKAAAAEMANRVAHELGAWATIDDAELAKRLTELNGMTPEGDALERARRLFAQVVDAPEGLRIATIHAFCQSLLRRFPLEAGLVPHFEVLDERTAAELMESARDEVLAAAAPEADPSLAAALAEVTRHAAEDEFHALMVELADARGRVTQLLAKAGGVEAATRMLYRRLGLGPGEGEAAIVAQASAEASFAGEALKEAASALAHGSATDRARGEAIAAWIAAPPAARAERFDAYLALFLTNDGNPRKTLATKAARQQPKDPEEVLRAEASRLAAALERRRTATTAAASAALLRLGSAVLAAYEAHKRRQAFLDYDDLILGTLELLESQGAAWVLYKLDQGVDHILIDEAQDTNPDQWRVVAALAEEFFAGAGAREVARTIFAVGDAKQSIFSFQRADPAAFESMRRRFAAKVAQVERAWRSITLEVSFRSTPAVLRAVDAVFSRPAAADGVVAEGETVRHFASRAGRAGLVELWPLVLPRERVERPHWSLPIGREAANSPLARLAALIAARIRGWIDEGELLPSRGRAIHAGDVMVLVRRRTVFVEELVRALKAAQVPVAGVDRMVLTDQLAVMDLLALGHFLLLPEDDLTLACVLKSPLVGLSEEQLFTLAYGRGGRSLWHELRRHADEDPAFAAAAAYLSGLLSRVDFTPPYELFAEILGGEGGAAERSGLKRILARLGPEAEEPLDEFLALALAYERTHVPSLEGFLHWVRSGQAEIKRDPEASARNEVRIMTVHAAKGLEAPIVILPDTVQVPQSTRHLLWLEGEGLGFLWPPRREHEDGLAAALRGEARLKRDQEYRRLLYVAMTRAQDRLYVCGWRTRSEMRAESWYGLVRSGLEGIAEPFAFDCRAEIADGWSGEGLRLSSPQEVGPEEEKRPGFYPAAAEPLPAWVQKPPPTEPRPQRPLAPSRPADEEPPIRSPLGEDEARHFRRGLLVHRLLELLPELPAAARADACARYLARPAHGLSSAARHAIARETLAVLEDPAFAPLFAPGSRAEVALVGEINGRVIAGQIDRLLVDERQILIVDYKTNRSAPESAAEIAPLYLKQMAAYSSLLALIYPGRTVRAALLFTEGPRLMALPHGLLERHAP